jgi:hypothetical protein
MAPVIYCKLRIEIYANEYYTRNAGKRIYVCCIVVVVLL